MTHLLAIHLEIISRRIHCDAYGLLKTRSGDITLSLRKVESSFLMNSFGFPLMAVRSKSMPSIFMRSWRILHLSVEASVR